MKAVAFSTLALCLALVALSAESPQPASPQRLAGIVILADERCAALELANPRYSLGKWCILSENEEDDGIRVTKIAPDKGSVDLSWQGTNVVTLRLSDATDLPVPGIVLEDAALRVVLHLFGQFTNRTLLCWPDLWATTFDLRVSVKDQAGAARILAQALAAKELSIIPDGEKFLMIVPNSRAKTVKPHAPAAKAPRVPGSKLPPAPSGSATKQQEAPPAGMIAFWDAAPCQVVDIYAMMVGRKLDRSAPPIFSPTITLFTQPGVTMQDGIYALETLLRWSGIKMVPVGDDRIKAVRDQEY